MLGQERHHPIAKCTSGAESPAQPPPKVWFQGHRPPKTLVLISTGEYLAPQPPFPARQKMEGMVLRDAASPWDYTCKKALVSPPRGRAVLPRGCGDTPGCRGDANTNLLSSEEAAFGNRQGLRYLRVAHLHCHPGTATLCHSPRSRGQGHGDHGWSWWLSPTLGGISAFG